MPEEHCVLIVLQFPKGKLDEREALDAVFELEHILSEVIELAKVGRCDGNEFCESPDESSVTFFIFGSDADKIYESISPILAKLPSLPGSYVLKQYNDKDVGEQIFL